MKRISAGILCVVLQGCSGYQADTMEMAQPLCAGSTELPMELASAFRPVSDEGLLEQAIGEPDKGKLCQGQVYQSRENARVILYRAWNSTNPNSKLGQWWAFQQPSGNIAEYREDYEICYQWSPLDKVVRCTLRAGTKVVVGNGQSARCSDYLTYPVSEKQQVYIPDAANAVFDCSEQDGVMRWE